MTINDLSMDENVLFNSTFNSTIFGESERLFTIILSILLIVVFVIGLIGNILVIYVVLNYGRLKTVTNTYLLHLALSDLIFLSGIPFFISSIITRAWIFGSWICKMFFLSQGINQYTSIIILASLSFDRFLAVCHPSKSITWRSRVNPNTLLISMWIFSFFLMLPIILFTTLQESNPKEVQCTIMLPMPHSRSVYFIYVVYSSMTTFFIPLSLMIYFHVRIVHHLQYRIPQQHRPSSVSMRTRRKVTILVLSVISVHLICCSPYWTFQMFTTSELLPQTSGILVRTSSFTQFLLFVNSSTNPILYAFISEVFRASFKRVFSRWLRTNSDQRCPQEATVVRQNMAIATNRKGSFPLKSTPPMITNDNTQPRTVPNRPLTSTKQKNIQPRNKRRRLSSLVPPASIFLPEVSCVSDV